MHPPRNTPIHLRKPSFPWPAMIFLLLIGSCGPGHKPTPATKQVKPSAADSTRTKRLEWFISVLQRHGDTFGDTSRKEKFLYFGRWYIITTHIVSVLELDNDTGAAVITLSRLRGNTNQPREGLQSQFRKVANRVSRGKSGELFHIFDSLAARRLIFPLGSEPERDRSGDIIDGGEWLIYFDGSQLYEYSTYNSATIDIDWLIERLWQSKDLKLLGNAINEPF